MPGDRERWNAKYQGALGRERPAPDAFVVRAIDRLGPGRGRRALDLAAGTGRHALELARRGWDTVAWDVSDVALDVLARRAAAAGLVVGSRVVDLLDEGRAWDGGGQAFDLVVVVDFLDRGLWARLRELVVPGGHVVARTFTVDWPGEKPPRRYRLEPGELRRGVAGFARVDAEEAEGRAGWVGRRGDDGTLESAMARAENRTGAPDGES